MKTCRAVRSTLVFLPPCKHDACVETLAAPRLGAGSQESSSHSEPTDRDLKKQHAWMRRKFRSNRRSSTAARTSVARSLQAGVGIFGVGPFI
jgi:hypothetical protein